MKFCDDIDKVKEQLNVEKHGINFIEARAIWNDPFATDLTAKTKGEPRFVTVGKIDGKLYAALWTRRGDCIRIFSVHRADNNPEFVREYNG